MVDFSLTDEQIQLRDLAYKFAKEEMRPVTKHYDQTGEWAEDVMKKAWGLGLLNIHIPQEFGGLGLKAFDGVLIEEELGWGCSGLATAITVNSLAQTPVIMAGTQEQKKIWLSPFAEEHHICSYAVTESGAGSDVAAIKTTAKKIKDVYILNGQKMWISGAGHAKWFFVLAKTDEKKEYKGMSAFIVPRDAIGVSVGKKEKNMGQCASDTRSVSFDNVEISDINRLGAEGDGFLIAMGAFDHTRPLVAAAAVGLSRAAMEHSIAYASDRKTFGKYLHQHEAIAFMVADMATEIEASRLLTYRAAIEIDKGLRNTKYAAFAKKFAADTAMKVTTNAVQVFGGNGFNKEYPVEKLMRDAKIFQIYEGTSQIQQLIISREIFSKRM